MQIKKKDLIFIGLVAAAYFIQKIISYKLGLYMEECRDANAYLMALDGSVPYKDINFWPYGPFAFSVYPLVFKFFGVNLAVLRLSYVVIGSLIIPLVYFLSRRLMPPAWSGLAAFLAVVLVDVPYYTYNHILASVSGLLALIFIVRFMEEERPRDLFISGIFIGISILVKPFLMGFGILFSVLFFYAIQKFKNRLAYKVALGQIAILFSGMIVAVAPFLLYFSAHHAVFQGLANIIPIGFGGSGRAGPFYVYNSYFPPLNQFWQNLLDIVPYKIFFSPEQWRTILVYSYYRLINFSPVLFPVFIVLLNLRSGSNRRALASTAADIFLLYALYSIFISTQSVFYLQSMGRSFTMQVSFILITYFLFLINSREARGAKRYQASMVFFLSIIFVFYLSYLHFLRYPYSRSKYYTEAMDLERAKDIRVSPREKKLYESLNNLFARELNSNESIAVIGYYPQFSFLLKRNNIFEANNDIFIKLDILLESCANKEKNCQEADKVINVIIDRIAGCSPKFILKPIRLEARRPINRIDAYVNDKYFLDATMGIADIDIYTRGIVEVYRIKQ